jgi:hypothetical protein
VIRAALRTVRNWPELIATAVFTAAFTAALFILAWMTGVLLLGV